MRLLKTPHQAEVLPLADKNGILLAWRQSARAALSVNGALESWRCLKDRSRDFNHMFHVEQHISLVGRVPTSDRPPIELRMSLGLTVRYRIEFFRQRCIVVWLINQ